MASGRIIGTFILPTKEPVTGAVTISSTKTPRPSEGGLVVGPASVRLVEGSLYAEVVPGEYRCSLDAPGREPITWTVAVGDGETVDLTPRSPSGEVLAITEITGAVDNGDGTATIINAVDDNGDGIIKL